MDRSKQIVRVSVIGILANLVLVAFKALVGLLTGSIAVILDAVNNLSDALSSVITILGTWLAGKAPDKKHPYGYGRIENITSVIIAVIVLLAGLTSFRESLDKTLHPEAASYTVSSLIIIAAAVVVKLLLGRYVKGKGKELNSESLIASGSDASFDAVISLSTLVAAVLSMAFHWNIEGILGLVISVVILKAGVEILLESLNTIIGQRVDGELAASLKEKVRSFPDVHGAYDLVLHHYGPERIIGSVHIEVDDDLTARELHSLSRQISQTVFAEFGIILTVGIYATNTGDDHFRAIRQSVEELLAQYPQVLQMHGFYGEGNHVSFDLIFSFGEDAAALRDEIVGKLSAQYPDYTFDVILDTDFSD